ncbi:MAG: glycoside hydrolase family 13 protein [bacterium]
MKLTLIILFIMMSINIQAQTNQQTNKEMQKTGSNNESFVPEWAKKVVWYQIFPDRFRNGDKNNEPTLESIRGSYPHDYVSPWQVHPWNSDWYKLQPYEATTGKDIWSNIQRRRYGGDLQGIIDKLDYLQELGITAIYLNPIFQSPSLHKYDGATYHHVDPYFGPNPQKDLELIKTETPHDPKTWEWTEADKLFLKLVEEVHKRNMKIIIDGVFNHLGINSWPFKDVVKNQEKSLYKDWFKIVSFEDTIKGTKFEYKGWWGVKELPELNQDENGITAGPKKYIFDITNRWMNPNNNLNQGIDGWRLDVAFMVRHNFWKDWRKHVKSINPNSYLTAEIIDSVKVNVPYLEGDEFDAVMNYNFAFSCTEFFINKNSRIAVSKFDKQLEVLRNAYPSCVSYVQQNLFDSHDTNRLLSHIVNDNIEKFRNWGKYFEMSKGSNPNYDTRKPDGEEYHLQKLMAIFQMTYLGAPMIYYGDEVGMWGANDPCCRKPMLWDDIHYEDEITMPDQSLKPQADKVEINSDVFNHYKKLIKIRNNNIALQLGTFKTVLVDNKNSIYAFLREYENNKVLVVINNYFTENNASINIDSFNTCYDVLNDEELKIKDGKLDIKIPCKWGRIIILNK